ncbi:MAG: glycoside hydrolase family 3 N-terminal domain-containing protein [Balneolaceae bacterium]
MMKVIQPFLNSASLFALFFMIMMIGFSACKSTEPSDTPQPVLIEPAEDEPAPQQEEEADAEQGISTANVDSLMAAMTLREKIGQLFVVPAYGRFTNDHNTDFLRLQRLITHYKIGGLVFMNGDVYGQATMTNKLQELSSVPLWITQDMEYGAAMRVRGTTRFTPAMGIAATGDPLNAFLAGKITAREAKALGVHQVFAPVLDVNNNPENPVINVRSFSADPDTVAWYGQHFIEGVESEGILATAKHFPGHGDTDTDSHLALPLISHTYERLDTLELVPFRATIDNGLKSVMSAHIAYPNISENIGLPGTLDPSILNRILVDSLNFEGLVVTDGLEMSGITQKFSPGEAVIQALLAGADMMLISPDEMTAVNEIERAVQSGRITEQRINRSVKKILELKRDRGAFENKKVDVEALSNQINTSEYQTIANRIARESLTVLKNGRNILPIRDISYQRVLVVSATDRDSGELGSTLPREVRKYHSNVTYHSLDNRTSREEAAAILKAADTTDLIIIGSFITVRSHQPIQMPSEQLGVLKQLVSRDKPSVLMAFGNPYVIGDLPETDVHILAWSSDINQVRQSVPGIFGAADIRGKMPAIIPDMYKPGDGIDFGQGVLRFDEPALSGLSIDSLLNIDMIMQEAIDDSVFPGGVVGVMKDGAMVWQQGYGYHDYTKTRAVSEVDVFDLASVTKVMATTTSIMKLVDQGDINLDDKVAEYIPEFNEEEKRDITIEHLLLHTSGLPAFKTYVDRLKTRMEILEAIKNEPLESLPGEKYVYSDLGFILLAEIVEQVSGTRIDRFIRGQFFYPMSMYSAHFNPKKIGRWISDRIPPTEIDDTYLRGVVRGDVHDERAYFMDGIAGHAGLFASARDIATYSYMMLNGGAYGGRQYLSPEIIDLFTDKRSPINQRGYGFDRKSTGFSTAGSLTSDRTFGHTGFTGTSIWMDPENDLAIILLTNRTYPSRTYGGDISRVRARIADAVMKSLQRE